MAYFREQCPRWPPHPAREEGDEQLFPMLQMRVTVSVLGRLHGPHCTKVLRLPKPPKLLGDLRR